jgi:hypothetical protein
MPDPIDFDAADISQVRDEVARMAESRPRARASAS